MNQSKPGFTLIELLIVIVIIATISATVFVAVDPATRFAQARNSARAQEVRSFLEAILEYQVDNAGDLPLGIDTTLRVLGTDGAGCDIACGGSSLLGFIADEESEFDLGAYSDTQFDAGNTWVELTGTGLSNGSGTYTSTIYDAGQDVTWDTIDWVPERPYEKELPNAGAGDSGYNAGNISMAGNQLLLHMNEASWSGVSGEVADSSGQGNSGTRNGDATTLTSGKYNRGGTFDGTGDYVLIPDDSSLEMTTGLTVAGWFYFQTDIGSVRLVEKGTSTSSNWEYRLLTLDDGVFGFNDAPFFQISNDGTNVGIQTFSNLALASLKDQWVFLAATYDGTDLDLYVNDTIVGTASGATAIHTGAGGLGVGADASGLGPFGPGRMDEIAVWNVDIGNTAVIDMYRRGVNRLSIQVRSCDDIACAGESFIGPDGTAGTVYSDLSNFGLGLPSLSLTNVIDNRYFQYRSTLETDDGSYSPELNSSDISYSSASTLAASACLDLSSDLVDTYMPSIPIDPSEGTAARSYYAVNTSVGERVNVVSCGAELGTEISSSR